MIFTSWYSHIWCSRPLACRQDLLFAYNEKNIAKMMGCHSYDHIALSLLADSLYRLFCWFDEVSSHVGKVHMASDYRWCLKAESSLQLIARKKWGSESHNCKQMNSANDPMSLKEDSSPVTTSDVNTALLTLCNLNETLSRGPS